MFDFKAWEHSLKPVLAVQDTAALFSQWPKDVFTLRILIATPKQEVRLLLKPGQDRKRLRCQDASSDETSWRQELIPKLTVQTQSPLRYIHAGPYYSTRNSRILLIGTPKGVPPNFRKLPSPLHYIPSSQSRAQVSPI